MLKIIAVKSYLKENYISIVIFIINNHNINELSVNSAIFRFYIFHYKKYLSLIYFSIKFLYLIQIYNKFLILNRLEYFFF